MSELFVVPAERHVERLAREGRRAETRASLRARLVAALLPDVALAGARDCRIVLGIALADASGVGQLGLFEGGGAPEDPLLGPLRRRGGASWVRFVSAVDGALAMLRARGATTAHLERAGERRDGVASARARTLALAMRALDDRLARAGTKDERLAGWLLADAIRAAPPETVIEALGARALRARWLLAWEPVDVAWWRALDDVLAPRGGSARVALPTFERRLEATRERDPLEILSDEIARLLDGPVDGEAIEPALGDPSGGPLAPSPEALARIALVRAADPVAQARAVVQRIEEALDGGASVERVAVACPTLDERTLGPLRRALEEAGIVFHEGRGAPPSSAPVVSAALLALEAAASLDRVAVARLLRSGYVDGARLVPEGVRADRALARVARRLEGSPTAAGEDAKSRLVRTAAPDEGEDAAIAAKIADALTSVAAPRTRGEHIRRARALWGELGIGARAGRGGLATFARDEAPKGVGRAERLAIARDARAWDALTTALDVVESVAQRAGALEQATDDEVFRLELCEALDGAASQPGAGRAAAVRIVRVVDLPGEALDLLVVLDANEGLLPRDGARDAFVSEALAAALARASRGAFVAPDPGLGRARELGALAVAAADSARVVLAFTREDAQGAPLAPSVVVDALERRGAEVRGAAATARAAAAGGVLARGRREREREVFFLDPERPRSEATGDLALPAAARALLEAETGGGERALAVTGLERFARCAFMGYAHVVLAAREAETRGELPDAREEGTLVHDALAAAFVATRELWPERPRDARAILDRGIAAADAVLARADGHAPLRAVARLRARDAVRAVLEAAVADEAWDFAAAEQPFGAGKGEVWPALLLEEGGTRLLLRGFIDRVDRAHGVARVRVVDYKRSKSTVQSAAGALGETALQVPLYACVASRRFRVPATGTYVPFLPRDVRAEGRGAAKAEARVAELAARDGALAPVERKALAVVSAVRRGALSPVPADDGVCLHCAVSGGCRKPRFAMAPREDEEEGAP